MKVMQGIKVKRLNKKRECTTTLERKCDCCDEDAAIEIELLNIKKNGKKEDKSKKIMRLCKGHFDTMKEYINYF